MSTRTSVRALTYGARTGVKVMPARFYETMDWAKQQGFISDPFGLSGDVNGTDFEVKPEFRDRVTIIPNPNKKDTDNPFIVEVKTTAKVDGNKPLYKNRFDNVAAKMTTKQRDASGVEPMLEQSQSVQMPQIGQEMNGYQFIGGDPSLPTSWRKK